MTCTIDFLFPIPSRPPSALSPSHWPGVSPESTEALLKALKDNHEKWHTFFNEKHFHNHAPHRSLALWAMGADPAVIRAGYERDSGYEKPKIKPPEPISSENFAKHLGDERYYSAYVDFFTDALGKHGIGPTLEEYIFSTKANLGEEEGIPEDQQPRMLARFFSGVVHPLIHTGYGAEFGLPGIVAEGLAQTAVHPPAAALLVPHMLFENSVYSTLSGMAETAGRAIQGAFGSTVQTLDSAFDSVLRKSFHISDEGPDQREKSLPEKPRRTEEAGAAAEGEAKGNDVHALDILGWVSQDMRFVPAPAEKEKNSFDTTIGKYAGALLKFANLWKLDVQKLGHSKDYLNEKIEELAWLVSVMYGVGGWTGRGKNKDGTEAAFNADFFLMHLVTSSIFIPSIAAYISPVAQAQFLHTYLVVALAMYVFRGCPSLDLVGFHKLKDLRPCGPQPTPSEGTLPSPESSKAVDPDPWLPIIQTSVVHPDEHVPKAQRALSAWASAFGTRTFTSLSGEKPNSHKATGADAAATGEQAPGAAEPWRGSVDAPIALELFGAEYLDGSLFVRAAELTASRMGRVREGEKTGDFWDFKGFYNSDTNETTGRKAHL